MFTSRIFRLFFFHSVYPDKGSSGTRCYIIKYIINIRTWIYFVVMRFRFQVDRFCRICMYYTRGCFVLSVRLVTNNRNMAHCVRRPASHCTSSHETRKQCWILDITIFLSCPLFSPLFSFICVIFLFAAMFLSLNTKLQCKEVETERQLQSYLCFRDLRWRTRIQMCDDVIRLQEMCGRRERSWV
jgi:hypothetical protein